MAVNDKQDLIYHIIQPTNKHDNMYTYMKLYNI